jgi:phosphotransferase system HPr (HPr) family protein
MRAVEIEIRNPSGLHARPAATFVKAAAAFRSTVTVENLTREAPPVNAKSILSFLGGGIGNGNLVRVTAQGEDEDQAIEALRDLIASGLGEAID